VEKGPTLVVREENVMKMAHAGTRARIQVGKCRITMKKVNLCAFLLVAILGGGCASVKVYRVKTDSNGNEIVDKKVEGIPYYMPRPWVEVYDPFVVDAKPYFINAVLTPDGKYLQLTSLPRELLDDKLKDLFPVAGAAPAVLETPEAPPAPVSDSTGLQGAEAGSSGTSSSSGASKSKGSSNGQSTSTSTNSTSGTSTNSTNAGKSSVKVTSTADFYVTPGRRFFDIVYLPDYADKRIIQLHGGLGKSDLSVTLAQGWSLAALNATVDNTELAKELYKTWDTGLQLAQKAATTAAFPPAGALQGQAADKGTVVTCKVIDSEMVAPGWYPLPKDIQYPKADAINGDMPFAKRLGLKTYHVYTVEALLPTGDSPLKFTQYATAGGTIKGTNATSGPPHSPSTPKPVDLTAVATAVKASLQTDAAFKDYKDLVEDVVATTADGKAVTFTLKLHAAPPDKATEAKIEAAFDTVAEKALKGIPGSTATLKKPTNVTPPATQ
jgi:hypothetical protein